MIQVAQKPEMMEQAVHARGASGRAYRAYRRNLGRGILLGLEFLVIAIGTVAIEPTFRNRAVPGLIVLIRTFLNLFL